MTPAREAARLTPVQRFWLKVDDTSDCWLWLGATSAAGYGRFWFEGRVQPAHRVAYELEVGPIPIGLTIDHLCRVRACVRPDHLEPVSQAENTMRGEGVPARNARKTHCVHGHEFTPENTRPLPRGGRRCRTCHRLHQRYYLAVEQAFWREWWASRG